MFVVHFRKHVRSGARRLVFIQTRTFSSKAQAAKFADTLKRRSKLNPAMDQAAGKIWHYSRVRIERVRPYAEPTELPLPNFRGSRLKPVSSAH
jgi:hypothetical protein